MIAFEYDTAENGRPAFPRQPDNGSKELFGLAYAIETTLDDRRAGNTAGAKKPGAELADARKSIIFTNKG